MTNHIQSGVQSSLSQHIVTLACLEEVEEAAMSNSREKVPASCIHRRRRIRVRT